LLDDIRGCRELLAFILASKAREDLFSEKGGGASASFGTRLSYRSFLPSLFRQAGTRAAMETVAGAASRLKEWTKDKERESI